MKEYFAIMFGLVFVQNFVLSQFLGLCPFIGVSKKRSDAVGMGLAVTFVMGLASFATLVFYKYVLLYRSETLHLDQYLDIVSFILIIAGLVQFVEIAMKKVAPALYRALGIYLPLITTNCAVLGVAQLNIGKYRALMLSNFPEALLKGTLAGIFGGVGFALALFLMAGIRERIDRAPVPDCMKGVPIAFLAAACMALAFFGFAGIV